MRPSVYSTNKRSLVKGLSRSHLHFIYLSNFEMLSKLKIRFPVNGFKDTGSFIEDWCTETPRWCKTALRQQYVVHMKVTDIWVIFVSQFPILLQMFQSKYSDVWRKKTSIAACLRNLFGWKTSYLKRKLKWPFFSVSRERAVPLAVYNLTLFTHQV